MPSHYFYSRRRHFARPVEAPSCDVNTTACEMIRIFGRTAESVALSQSRKFADRGDEEGAQIWLRIGAVIGQLKEPPR